jgi:hypothetical protein
MKAGATLLSHHDACPPVTCHTRVGRETLDESRLSSLDSRLSAEIFETDPSVVTTPFFVSKKMLRVSGCDESFFEFFSVA